MKVTFTTNEKGFQNANYILEQALQSLHDNPKNLLKLGLKNIDLYEASIFRRQLVKGFIASAKRPKKLPKQKGSNNSST